jgi:hypothetical protein
LGYTHETVNHSQYFKDPNTGVHTNSIEGTWKGLKRNVPITHRTREYMGNELYEFIWRRVHENEDLFEAFLKSLTKVKYLSIDSIHNFE